MKKLLFIILAVCIISCSPVAVSTLPDADIEQGSATATATITGEHSINITFTPAAFASEYAYAIDNENAIEEDASLTFKNGLYAFNIFSGLNDSGNIFVFGRKNGGEWVKIATAEYVMSLANIQPDAYLSKRGETEAEIRIDSELDPSSVDYEIEITSDNPEEKPYYTYSEKNNSYTISGLTAAGNYTATIRNKLKTETSYGANSSTTVTITPYDSNNEQTITLEISETKDAFNISGIPSSTNISLYKTNKTSPVFSNIDENADGTATIPFRSLKSLESGYFFVSTGNGTVNSNILKYTIPLRIESTTANYRSAEIKIDIAEDVKLSDSNFSIEGNGLQSAEISVSNSGVRIGKLDSDTSYDFTLRYVDSEYMGTESIHVDTKSFAGTYSWEGNLTYNRDKPNPTNFQIVVKETSEIEGYEGDFPYYVYFADGDESIIEQNKVGEEIRIMPLIDTSNGEKSPTLPNGVNCTNPGSDWEKQNYAYLTNAKKWNALEDTDTKSWYIANMNRTHDTFITVAWAGAMIFSKPSEQLATTTTFDFLEADTDGDGIMEPFVKFQNIGSTMVQLGLYSNGTTRNDIEPDLNLTDAELKTIWYLSKID